MLLCLGKQKPRLSDFLPFQLQDVNRMYACGEVRGCLTVWPKGRLWSLGTSSTLVHLVALAVAGIAAEACVWCDTGTSSLSLCPSLSSPALPWAPTTITYSFDSLCDSHSSWPILQFLTHLTGTVDLRQYFQDILSHKGPMW